LGSGSKRARESQQRRKRKTGVTRTELRPCALTPLLHWYIGTKKGGAGALLFFLHRVDIIGSQVRWFKDTYFVPAPTIRAWEARLRGSRSDKDGRPATRERVLRSRTARFSVTSMTSAASRKKKEKKKANFAANRTLYFPLFGSIGCESIFRQHWKPISRESHHMAGGESEEGCMILAVLDWPIIAPGLGDG